MIHRVDAGKRQAGVYRPDSLTNLAEQAFRAGQRASDNENSGTLDELRLALEILHQDGPIDVGARGLVHSIVADVANHADDLAPVVHVSDAKALAQSGGGRAPIFACEIFGNQRDGDSVVRVGPSHIAPGEERYAHRL